MLLFYTLAMFISALLLFLIQPMFARMILPLLGGSPAVWNTAVVFYQAVLLAGYLCAHLMTKYLHIRRQIAVYGIVLLLPLVALPIGVPSGWIPPTEENPIPWLLLLLFVSVGLPFFVVSTSSPVIQYWFGQTKHESAQDPYFLYAASNIGSMLGLLIYPAWIEQYFRLSQQSWLWTGGYILYIILILTCAIIVWRSSPVFQHDTLSRNPFPGGQGASSSQDVEGTISVRRRVWWVLWTFVPSSLMLSVTTYLSTNIAAVPLLWVIPLALYLLTFVLVFAKTPLFPHWLVVRAVPIVMLPLLIVIITNASDPIWILFPLHLIAFFIISLACHGALANDRPSKAYLTEFYMWVSIGGVLGGLFNALLAPIIFNAVLEYPLAIAIVAFFPWYTKDIEQSSRRWSFSNHKWINLLSPLLVGIVFAGFILGVQASNIVEGSMRTAIIFGPTILMCFALSRRPLLFGASVGAILLVGILFYRSYSGQVIYQERSFFGVHRVLADTRFHMLVHGTTLHGVQSIDPARKHKSLSYYHQTGPIGQLFTAFNEEQRIQRVASVGLGVGSLACYQQHGQTWTFYEIDPTVKHIALDEQLFTYLSTCAPDSTIVLGDARLSLQKAPEQHYDVMIFDAYSSDSIPIHLITRESLALYLNKLAPHGVMAFHISNRYIDLKPVLTSLALDAGLICLHQNDVQISQKEQDEGKWASEWIILARSDADVGKLAQDQRWQRLQEQPDVAVWTDDFASLFSVFRW